MTAKTKIFFLLILLFSLSKAQSRTIIKLDLAEKQLPFGLVELVSTATPKVGVALSGGGARSISQIGVLKALEEKNIPIEYVVGTSMGSIIGGLYSSGYNIHELDSLMRNTNWDDFFSPQQSNRNDLFIDQKITEDRAILSFRMEGLKPIIPTSLSSGQRAANFLNLMAINAPLISDSTYDMMRFKFRAISSDLVSGKEVIIDKGPLGAAMRASSSVTLLLPPVKKDSMMLVDGGLVANVPAKEVRKLGADIVVAVNASSPLMDATELDVPWRIADQLVSIPMRILNDQQLAEADFIIEPQLNGKKNSDFNELDTIVKLGYQSVAENGDNILKRYKEIYLRNLGGEEKVFNNLSLSEQPTEEEKKVYSLISNTRSVSDKELQFALHRVFSEGWWKNATAEIEESGGRSVLHLLLNENTHVKQIVLDGSLVIGVDSVMNVLKNLIDKPFSPVKTFNGALNVLRLYKRNGYSFARIEKVSFDSSSNSLSIKLDEGVITKITVVGNNKTKEQIITREFPLKVGDYFKYNIAEKGLTNLRSTNLFDQIELSVEGKNGKNELKISLLERVSAVIRLGMRLDNEYQAQFFLDVRDENFNGTGTELGALISGGVRNRSYSIEQKAIRVFDSYLTYKLRGFYEFTDINNYVDDVPLNPNKFSRSKSGEYRQINYGGMFGIGAQVERFGNLFLEARYQRDKIAGLYDYTGPSYSVDISSLRLSLFVDSQNEYPYPTKGFLVKAFYETAQTAFGGDVGYTKAFFDYKAYFGLRSDHVWSFRTMIGSGDNTLPLSQQFSLGGQNNFLGLREYEFRGRQIFLSSIEVRYKLPVKLFFDTYISARYDLGSVWGKREAIRFRDLRHGTGITVSFNTPIGPADFSVGKSFYFKNELPRSTIVRGPTFFYFTIGYYY
ncbi:MAG: hypothetical protein C4517_13805 [Stygiobacter sp.]|nr:MAG: hypothetical protein C4517_13805 [Stygiobacter sp.]